MFCICAVSVIGHLLVTQHTEIKNLIELMDYGLFITRLWIVIMLAKDL
jgi:hypothetical protein